MTLPIVERLRRRAILTGALVGDRWIEDDADCAKAADTIEELMEALTLARIYVAAALQEGRVFAQRDLNFVNAVLAKTEGGK